MSSATQTQASAKKRRFHPSDKAKHRARVAQAYMNLGLSQLALGSGGILARFAMEGMAVCAVGALRLGLVGAVLVGRLVYLRRPPLKKKDEWIMVGAGLLLAEQFLTWMLSINYLTIGTATLLYCTAPLWNGLYEVFFLKRKLPVPFWLSLALSGVGIGLMVHTPPGTRLAEHRIIGIALALASGIGVAAHLIVMRGLVKHGLGKRGYGPLDLLARSYTYAALVLLVGALIQWKPLPPFSDWHSWGAVISMTVLAQGFGQTLQNVALKHVRATIVGFSTLLEPVIATLLAAVVFSERFTLLNGIGAAVVLGSLGWALKFTQEAELSRK